MVNMPPCDWYLQVTFSKRDFNMQSNIYVSKVSSFLKEICVYSLFCLNHNKDDNNTSDFAMHYQ